MSNTSSNKSVGTSAQQYSTAYQSKDTYAAQNTSISNSVAQTPTPRRVISESSYKARARNNIHY